MIELIGISVGVFVVGEVVEHLLFKKNRAAVVEPTVGLVDTKTQFVKDAFIEIDQKADELSTRLAALEQQLEWHSRVKHGELEQGFHRLEDQTNKLAEELAWATKPPITGGN